MILTEENLDAVRNIIRDLLIYWKNNPASVLTEFDLQALLYSKLINCPNFSGEFPTADEAITCTKVHGELSWYGPNEQLEIKPDITILDPRGLSITRNIFEDGLAIPSKQCAFKGQAIIIEIKVNKYKRYAIAEGINKDIESFDFLLQKFQHEIPENRIHAFHVIVDRCNISNIERINTAIIELDIHENYELFYECLGE